ncbi:MAG: VTT domain-containing protein [Caldilineaceae bacterium]|nr:VTT domain-containing protein [Caldilineaceae bacterium]
MSQSPASYPVQEPFPAEEAIHAGEMIHTGGKAARPLPALPVVGDQPAPLPEPPVITDWRMNVLRIGVLVAITLGSCWLALNPEWVRSFGRWGYLSVFVISLLSSATVLVPAPGLAVVFAMGAALDPVTLGIIAGIGSGLGELSGYIAGASGRGLILRNKGIHSRLHWFTTRYTYPALFVLAILPLPVFDLAGVMAGALKMRVSHFLTVVISGKIIKHVLVAMVGAGSWGLFRHLLGM